MPQFIKYFVVFILLMPGLNSFRVSGQGFAISTVPAKCYSEKSGIIQLDSIQGIAPYILVLSFDSLRKAEIKRSPLLKEGGYSFKEISAGKYYISSICGDGQIYTRFVAIDQPPQLIPGKISVEKPPSSELAVDGIIIAHPVGGIPPYSFSWQGIGVKGIDSKISGLGKGIFKCNIIDSHGCGPVSATIILKTKAAAKATSYLDYLTINNLLLQPGQLILVKQS